MLPSTVYKKALQVNKYMTQRAPGTRASLFAMCNADIWNTSLIFLDDTKVLICYEKSQFVCILLTFLLTLF